ncbi:MAG: hypothetical protein D6679_04770 [Candidatus Hydrogenedentota bacterium]|nr:MAG: hypothetical protein D6679_04770 [Candidatus Hydrogenedentota bacterium]
MKPPNTRNARKNRNHRIRGRETTEDTEYAEGKPWKTRNTRKERTRHFFSLSLSSPWQVPLPRQGTGLLF